MAIVTESVEEVCRSAKRAARVLAAVETSVKKAALERGAAALQASSQEILDANRGDVAAGRAAGLSDALIDRLTLDERRIDAMAAGVRESVTPADPVGEVLEEFGRPNGLPMRKVRVPLGVIAVVYEARPNVTIDAAALCLKSGNAVVLRGSSAATHYNAVLAAVAGEAASGSGLPPDVLSIVAGAGHDELAELATPTGLVDLTSPRG